MVTPRNDAERLFTHSSVLLTPSRRMRMASRLRMSSHAALRSSYISAVIATRCARAFSRASRKQLKIDDGLSGASSRLRSTLSASMTP